MHNYRLTYAIPGTLVALLLLLSTYIAPPVALANPGPCRNGVTNVGLTIQDGKLIRGSGSLACPAFNYGTLKLEVILQRKLGVFSWHEINRNVRESSRGPVNWRLSVKAPCSSSHHRTLVIGTWTSEREKVPPQTVVTSNELKGCK